MSITPKNWDSFQHYKDRSPAWIKLHRSLLDDFTFSKLPVASRALAPLLWLLASEYDGGKITASNEELAYRFRIKESELDEAIKPLIENGFFAVDSKTLAPRKRRACLEERTSKNKIETEKEKNDSSNKNLGGQDFEEFYRAYPKHVGRGGAERAYSKALKIATHEEIMFGLNRLLPTIASNDPKFIAHPSTWLNDKGWMDELPAATKTHTRDDDPAWRGVQI